MKRKRRPPATRAPKPGRKVPLLDLAPQHVKLKRQLTRAFHRVLDHGQFILGPEVEDFEQEVARMCGVRHAIGCASGSDALLLALTATGIKPGDEVITSAYSFYASASCIARVGARAVFVDICPGCYNMDPTAVLGRISSRTRAIIVVHLFGQTAELTPWLGLARERGIRVIEDVAQAFGATCRNRLAGTVGDIGCLSFFPTKNLGGLGDGGMLLTQDNALAEKLRILRVHGMSPKYHHQVPGVNSRLDTLQAAWLSIKLPHVRSCIAARQHNASLYQRWLVGDGLADHPATHATCNGAMIRTAGDKPLSLPAARLSGHTFHQFILRTADPGARDPLRQHLQRAGIGTEVYYPVPLHLQKSFAPWDYREGEFPNSELAAKSTFALPIYPGLIPGQIRHVVDAIRAFYR